MEQYLSGPFFKVSRANRDTRARQTSKTHYAKSVAPIFRLEPDANNHKPDYTKTICIIRRDWGPLIPDSDIDSVVFPGPGYLAPEAICPLNVFTVWKLAVRLPVKHSSTDNYPTRISAVRLIDRSNFCLSPPPPTLSLSLSLSYSSSLIQLVPPPTIECRERSENSVTIINGNLACCPSASFAVRGSLNRSWLIATG